MIIAIASGKGGVGKTTISVNVAVLLSFLGRTVVVDGDVALPNVHVHLNLSPSASLPEVLKGEASLKEAIYELPFKVGKKETTLHILPSSGPLEKIDLDGFPEVVKELDKDYDFVIVDVAAGLSKYALLPIMASEKIYVVVNPEKASIEDGKRVISVASSIGKEVSGVIVNRYKGEKALAELAQKEISENLAGIVRESKLVKKAWEIGKPFVVAFPSSAVSKDVAKLAKNMAGMKTEIKKYGKLKYFLRLA